MNLDDIKQILDLVREHDLAELEIERDGLKVRVRKSGHQVAIMPPVVEGPGSPVAGASTPKNCPEIPARYRSPKTSQLTLSVEEGGNPPFDIDMKP
jgi:hypothetical protein